MSDYVAASCNIGPAEIKRRKQGALLGAILFAITTLLFVLTDAPTSTRLLVFIPALLFSVGIIQTRRKFCVAYGFLGVFSFEKLGATRKITINQDLKADRKYAIKLLLQSVFAAAVMTALVALI
ncbi:MAG: hypothetical protein RL193_888 [Actinomycetota bacterium]|jgi:hypothetical protein